MRPHAQAFLDVLAASATARRREARGHSHYHVTSACSLVREGVEKRAPTRVVHALGKLVVTHQPRYMQVFDTDATVRFRIVLGSLEMEVLSLARNLAVFAGDFPRGLAPTVAALLAAAQRALRRCACARRFCPRR